MKRSTVVPALIGIGAGLLVLLLVGGVVFAVTAVTSAVSSSSSGGSSSKDDKADEDDDEDAADDDAPAGTDDIAGLTIGDGPVEVVGYFDLMCPYCNEFVTTNEDHLTDLVMDGEITLELRPVSILDAQSTTDYSTRAAAALACMADINPDDVFSYLLLLFDQQPAEGGEGLPDSELVQFADAVGGDSIEDCVDDGTWLDWVTARTDEAIDDDGLTGTPLVLVDGEQYTGALDDAAEFADFVAAAA